MLKDKKKGFSSNIMPFFTGSIFLTENKKETSYSIQIGKMTQVVIGDADKGLPFGVLARLIKIWIDTEIIYSSRGKGNIEKIYSVVDEESVIIGFKIIIPYSLTNFLTKTLGLSKGSFNLNDIQDQLVRMANIKFKILFYGNDGSIESEEKISFINNYYFSWVEKKMENSFLMIDPLYYKDIVEKRRWIMLDMEIIRKFIRNIEGIDIYRYVKHSCCTLKVKEINITMNDLKNKLGSTMGSKEFLIKLKNIVSVINKDSFVSAKVISSPGKESLLQLHSTKYLINTNREPTL
jgi:hypothetical protein